MKRRFLFVVLTIVCLIGVQVTSAFAQADVPSVLTLPEQIAGGRDVTITVTDMPPADQAEARAQWEAQAARFKAMYPNVTVTGLELQYDPAAFAALIAGGQLPTLYRTYFTEPSKLIANNAAADLTALYESSSIAGVFNPELLDIMSADGKIYGIPGNAYALGLVYNIELLSAAGYDAPPATWEELTEMAVALTDRDAGVSGFAFINDGSGATGWHFTNLAYSLGANQSDIISMNDDGTYSADFGSNEAVLSALQLVHDLRWTYDVLPGEAMGWVGISEALVSDRIAMGIYAGDQFNFVHNQFPDTDISRFGYAPVPASDNGFSTLTGGNLWMVSASASADEQEAAAYYQLWRQFDPAEMQAAIEVTTEAVGMPIIPLYVGEYQEKFQSFRDSYNILPVENYATFNEGVQSGSVNLQAEPLQAVQDYYTEMGVLVSEILSNESTDITTRLSEVASDFQSFVLDQQ